MAECGRHARQKNAARAITTAAKIPAMTPTNATPAKLMIDNPASVGRSRMSRSVPVRSTSEVAATMTTAPRVACGRLLVMPGATRSSAMIATAATTPVICVLPPAASATGVRDALALTGNPDVKAPPIFAAPSATSSWF